MSSCPNLERIMIALNRGAPDKVPSFCQSILGTLQQQFMEKYEDDLTDEDILITEIGDLTIYKAFGYSSHWSGAPHASIIADATLQEYIEKQTKEIRKKSGFEHYYMTTMGAIRGANQVTHWFVEGGITTEEQLKFFMDHLSFKEPPHSEIDKWKRVLEQCYKVDFVPFVSSSVVVEPANQSLSFALTGKLMRKNPELITRFYDFLVSISESQFKAAIKAGAKAFCTADDCAYKTGPMLSPANYRKFVTPCAKRLCDLVRDADGVIFMHTDGFVDPIMDCFIDAGYHAIQPLEPSSGMTIERVKRLWGDKLAVIGNCDTSGVLSFGTEQETRQYVHRCFREAKGTADKVAGYVFAASGTLHEKVKLENALAMMDEYKKIRDGVIPI